MIWGVLLSVCSILAIVFWSSHLGKASAKTGAGLVSGLILGTIIGGACTIGTAQLAFLYGMSAWWYCLGAGLACLVLAFGFSNAIRRENGRTLLGIVGKEYGRRVGLYASFLNSFLHQYSVSTYCRHFGHCCHCSQYVFGVGVISFHVFHGCLCGRRGIERRRDGRSCQTRFNLHFNGRLRLFGLKDERWIGGRD